MFIDHRTVLATYSGAAFRTWLTGFTTGHLVHEEHRTWPIHIYPETDYVRMQFADSEAPHSLLEPGAKVMVSAAGRLCDLLILGPAFFANVMAHCIVLERSIRIYKKMPPSLTGINKVVLDFHDRETDTLEYFNSMPDNQWRAIYKLLMNNAEDADFAVIDPVEETTLYKTRGW
jgi:hypothetical protein